MSSIPDFVSQISKNPLLVPNRYDVNITSPVGTIDKKMSMNCVSANVPARTIATIDRFIYGPTTKIGYVEIFDDLNLTFRLSADMIERSFFDLWMNKIGGKDYQCAYFNEVKGSIILQVYHSDNRLMKTYEFIDVLPLNLSESTFTQDAETFATVSVQFGYHHYEWK